jgi:hypothetical protein
MRSVRSAPRRAVALMTIALVLAATAVAATASSPAPASASTPTPTVSGPVQGGAHGRAFNEWPWPLEDYGYEQVEYFISGTARAFGTALPPAKYTTRIQVFRPKDRRKASGTAMVEWSNVTANYDIPLGWVWAHPYLMGQGDVVVLVSAQEVGVCGDKSPLPGVEVCSPTSLQGWDVERYGSLVHPGDDYSFDIFSQAVQAVRRPGRVNPVAGIEVRHVVGYGQSQSAQRLDGYVCNGADAAARVLDAVVSDADVGRTIACTPRVPTIQLWSEDSAKPVASTSGTNKRIWMLPGAPHEDAWQADYAVALALYNNLGIAPRIPDNKGMQSASGGYGEQGLPNDALLAACLPKGNAYPRRYVVDAALQAVKDWALSGRPAPVVEAMSFSAPAAVDTGFTTTPVAFEHDQHGNATGGLRSPVLDVPVATYVGSTCALFGQTISFSPVQLALLYPDHETYVSKLHAKVQEQVTKGLLLPVDARDLMQRACASRVGGAPTAAGQCPAVTARSPYRVVRRT